MSGTHTQRQGARRELALYIYIYIYMPRAGGVTIFSFNVP
ncbi:hypothetical protein LTSEMON_2730 [Salmonella enterica subsp. enterica serovar Montevideo str. S5-403]|uniref:Uncharacterized protein n=1 Tax=Salmonella enterica subsp. enterica serovar Montevideo str. S5-403 TaxID=913242 RepID=G5Q3Y1_SALMO|nr:hypothetical protein LTSEMON_2730 [Salmonella enterica subsp. enterica serovar Montevideo str. S5-403]